MNRPAVMQAAYFAVIAMDEEPTRRNMEDMIRRITGGRGMRAGEVLAYLKGKREPNGNRSGTKSEPQTVLKTADPEPQAGTTSRAPHKVLESEAGSLFAIAKSEPTPKPKKPPAEWTVPLLADTTTLNERELRSLTATELFTLSRAHALLFGNCTVTEQTNKARASPIAAGLKYLLDTLRRGTFADLTVREYLDAGRNVTKRRGGSPWFKPSLIIAELTEGAVAHGKPITTQPGHDTGAERRAPGRPLVPHPEAGGQQRHALERGAGDREREHPPPALAR